MASAKINYSKTTGKPISVRVKSYGGLDSRGKEYSAHTKTYPIPDTVHTEKQLENFVEKLKIDFDEMYSHKKNSSGRRKFAKYAEEILRTKFEMGDLKKTTYSRYLSLLDRINKQFGNCYIDEITVEMLEQFYSNLAKPGENQNVTKEEKESGIKKCLSPKTIKEYHNLISSILKVAWERGYVKENVAQKARKPKTRRKPVNYHQPEDIRNILKKIENEPIKWKTMIYLYILLGARRGEIIGLYWKSIDFDKKTITINNEVLYTPEFGVYEDTTKTDASIRTLNITDELIDILKEYKKWQDEQKEISWDIWERDDLVFTNEKGGLLNPDTVNARFRRMEKRLGLPKINPHSFRHSLASVGITNPAVNIFDLSRILGHASTAVTESVYIHEIEQSKNNSTALIQDTILGKKK